MEVTNTELTVTGSVTPECLRRDLPKYGPERLDMVTMIDYDEEGGFRFGLNIHTHVTGRFGRDPRRWA